MKTPEQLKGTIRSMAAKKNLRAQEVLQMFLFERILERMANSRFKDNFILKGGLLISSMIGITERTTMDMDTTVRGIQMEEDEIVSAVKEIVAIDVEDGIVFEYKGIEPIREEDAYNNFRVHLQAKYGKIDMMIALDYVWDSVKKDLTKKKAVMIDEIWKLVGTSSNKQAAEFCLTIFKTIRGFGGAAVSATQDLSDFFGLEDGKYGRAIINNSKNKIILNLEPDEAKYVQDVLKLTKTEVQSITRFERGEALIYSNNNKVPVLVKASKAEHEMITTDRAELEAILRQR